jgi:UDP-N-acetylglucosamine 1-carboxyvinyltransferase
METLKVTGNRPLCGEVTVDGNKNAVLPVIAASLLTDEELVIRNVPEIIDVKIMLEAVESLGVEVSFSAGILKLQARQISNHKLSRNLCSKIRTSILLTGPLLTRTGKASLWPPGGDVIGRRRLDGHFYGLSTLGAEIATESFPFKFSLKGRFRGRELFLDEASVTATEQILLAAVLAEGQTILRNAAAEPHVRQLAELLVKMGANITGLGSNTLTIDGVEKLHGTDFAIEGDHIEAGSFLAMAAATQGEITINGICPGHYWMTRRIFERFGIHFEMGADYIHLPRGQKLKIKTDWGNAIPTVSDGPWPQFPSDMISCTLVMATQAEGSVLFFEKMFESRIYFVDRLISMGANAIVCDPHRAVISGPSQLRGIEMSSPDIRAGMAMLIAALCAKGESIIHNASVISRGYAGIVGKITSLGGNISN